MKAWLSPKFDDIPQLLQQHDRWLLWAVDGSGRKTPRNTSKFDRNIDASKAANWSSYNKVVELSPKFQAGIGFALGPVQDGPTFSGIDLDKCRDPVTGAIEPWAQRLITYLDSYTEISPSGTGVKIFVLGSLPDEARQGKVYKLEIYDRARYFAVTGHHLPGTPTSVENREDRMRLLHAEAWSRDLTKLVKLFGFYLSDGRDWINLRCPWIANHSGGNQERDAGLKLEDGKVVGFNCFHASCSERTLSDVRALFGLKGGDSSDFICDHNGVIIKESQENIRRAVTMMGVKLEHNVFEDKLYIVSSEGRRRPIDDPAVNRMWLLIDEQYKFRPSKEFFETVIDDWAREAPYHPVLNYLNGLKWDGVKRIDQWLIHYAGAEDTELTRVVSGMVLIAGVRRIRKPGCKFDEMLVVEAQQGQGKSTGISSLCPNDEWFSDDLPLNVGAKEIIERTAGKWIIEASDMSGMRKSDVEHLKAMLSRRSDGPVRMAYGHFPIERQRSFILIGTTNSRAYLKDTTGNRRFYPIKVKTFDIEGLLRDRDQLWAEAAHREAQGESIRLDPKFWDEMAGLQEERRINDEWEIRLMDADIDLKQEYIPVASIWAVLEVTNFHNPNFSERIQQVMQHLGYPIKRRARFDGRIQHCWVRLDIAEEHGWVLKSESDRPNFVERRHS